MNKRLFAVLTALFVFCISAYAKPPKVTGNFEQGSRYAIPYGDIAYPFPWLEGLDDEFEQETWAYDFHKGYLQVAQVVSPGFRYATRLGKLKQIGEISHRI